MLIHAKLAAPKLHGEGIDTWLLAIHPSSSSAYALLTHILIFKLFPTRLRRLIRRRLHNIQPQPGRIQIHLILALLQNLRNIPCILKLPQINIRPRFLDRVTDELGRAGLTLGSHNGSLFLLAGFVDDEGGALGFLLGDLLGFDDGGEFGGEGEVLQRAVRDLFISGTF